MQIGVKIGRLWRAARHIWIERKRLKTMYSAKIKRKM